jgi:hypothetical protein
LLNTFKSGKKEYKIEIIKNLDKEKFKVDFEQFYFDSDVIKLNKYLSGSQDMIDNA